MPRTSSTSATSSSRSSRNSEHFPYRYVDLENVMKVFSRRENITTAINLANNDQIAFAKITFLDYLFQNIRRSEIRKRQTTSPSSDHPTLDKEIFRQTISMDRQFQPRYTLSSSYWIAAYPTGDTHSLSHFPFLS
jgi:hypothetical protein